MSLSCDKTNTAICPVLAALRLVLRSRRLSQPDSMPVACYLKKEDALAYITGSRVAFLFRAVTRVVHPNISKDKEQRYSAHSLRVWACFLLDKAGKSPDYIKKHIFVGWVTPSGCICVIHASSRTSTARPCGHCLKGSWT